MASCPLSSIEHAHMLAIDYIHLVIHSAVHNLAGPRATPLMIDQRTWQGIVIVLVLYGLRRFILRLLESERPK
jgi:hypothetical protein